MMGFLQRLLERWRAWRRGEVRVAPSHAMRGRLYGKRGVTTVSGGGAVAGKAEPKAHISARVYRAETGTWEDRGVISEPGKE
jgi:hypothetical protein